MDIIAGISALNTAIDIARKVNAAQGAYDAATLKYELAEMLTKLAEAKITLADAREELAAKDRSIAELKLASAFVGETIVRDQLHYRKHADGQPVGRPFCPRCWEIDKRWVSMQHKANTGSIFCWCPECQTNIHASSYVER